jgi:hypothetical protein
LKSLSDLTFHAFSIENMINVSSDLIQTFPTIFAQLFSKCHSIVISHFDISTSPDISQLSSYSKIDNLVAFFCHLNQFALYQQFLEILFQKEINKEGKASRFPLRLTIDDENYHSIFWVLFHFPQEKFFQYLFKIDLAPLLRTYSTIFPNIHPFWKFYFFRHSNIFPFISSFLFAIFNFPSFENFQC